LKERIERGGKNTTHQQKERRKNERYINNVQEHKKDELEGYERKV